MNKKHYGHKTHTPQQNAPLYRKARVLLLPSTRETWAMVASEAGAVGVPTLTYADLQGVIENVGEDNALECTAPIADWVEMVKKAKPSNKVQSKQKENYAVQQSQLKETVDFVVSYG